MEEQPQQLREEELKESTEQEPEITPRIYVASLADYNAGRLYGTWIEAAQDPEDIQDAITGMLLASPMGVSAEEWAIHDFEGFNGLHLGEWEDLAHVSKIARGITEHGLAYAHWAQLVATDEELDKFEDCYLGRWDSVTAYAEEMLSDLGIYERFHGAASETLIAYLRVDAEGFGRDLELGGDITTARAEGGGVYVFANH